MKSLPELVTDQDIREMFDTADDDGDGLIDIEEFGRMVIYQSYLCFFTGICSTCIFACKVLIICL